MIEFDELNGIAEAIERFAPFSFQSDEPAQKNDAFPNTLVPVLIARSGANETDSAEEFDWNWEAADLTGSSVDALIVPVRKQWGFETADRTQVIFNTRIETADERPLWKDSIEHRRCVVPIKAFYETNAKEKAFDPKTGRSMKQSYRFTSPDGVMLLAGIWKGDRFSIITTQPNAAVASVHDRMPLVLTPQDAHEWLVGDWQKVAKTSNPELASSPLYQPQISVEQPSLFD